MLKSLTTIAALLCCSAVFAQTAAPAAPAAPAKAAKPAAAKPGAKKAAPAEAPLPAAEGEQNAAAAMVHFGTYACEFKQTVQVAMNPKYDGYVDVSFGKQKFTMKPVLSSTGALRLEDVKGQALMLQIAYKSMIMDTKAGRRLVDECVHEKQLEAKTKAEATPAQALLSGEQAPAAK